jgi:hypothetical protein
MYIIVNKYLNGFTLEGNGLPFTRTVPQQRIFLPTIAYNSYAKKTS